MTTSLAVQPVASSPPDIRAIESVLIGGDLAKLTPEQRVSYYNHLCESLGLNPMTQPFAYITLNGKLRLYALKDATEQLRKIHGVSITEMTSQRLEDVFVVTVKAQDKTGRTDAATGAVPVGSLKGESLANALMKAETKAKRRATLSIVGLGMLDETEVESIPQPVVVEPPKAERPTPPTGACYLERVESKRWGAEVTLSDGEVVYARQPQLVALCEAIVQEGVAVVVDTKPTPKGKVELVAVHRWKPEPTAEENARLDAEIAAKEGLPL